MDENTKKIIKERFDSLPKSIQEIILSTNYQDTLIEIGKQHQINVEQLGILERETTLVMMGLTPTKDFEKELTRELNIDNIKGSQITEDINSKIFLKIRELLKIMNTEPEEVSFTEKTPAKTNDSQILNSAGIEIVPTTPPAGLEKLEIPAPAEKREEILKKIEKPEAVHPILVQKLSSPMQTPMVKTEHTLNNLTPSNTPKIAPKIDPYREIPE